MKRINPWNLVLIENQFISSKSQTFTFLFLWLCACALAFRCLGDLPLRDFDEATVARVAFELSQKTGQDQILPTLWGDVYLNKPPGLHWLIAVAINFSHHFNLDSTSLPSEFVVRAVPAFLSTLVVPLGGLIQISLRPKDPISSFATSGILLTTLPLVRHGRLAMLDGTILTCVASLWLLLLFIERGYRPRLNTIFLGLICSFLLLLKAPFLLPAILAGLIPIVWQNQIDFSCLRSLYKYFLVGLLPGLLWHAWHFFNRGYSAFWLWGGDGAVRVLFDSGEGSDLGALVPIIEILEGGWPWLLLWPFGIFIALRHTQTRWAKWIIGTQLVLGLSILPLKTQLPWYSHSLWLPFALTISPVISLLIQGDFKRIFKFNKILLLLPSLILMLGLTILTFFFLAVLNIFPSLDSYSRFMLPYGLGCSVGGLLLNSSSFNMKSLGVVSIFSSSFIALYLFVSSSFWIWELNESWNVKPVANMINDQEAQSVFIVDSIERPSLNWYAGQKIKTFSEFEGKGLILINNLVLNENEKFNQCLPITTQGNWSLISCETN